MSPDTLVEGKIKKAGILKDTHVRLKMKITIHNMFTCSISAFPIKYCRVEVPPPSFETRHFTDFFVNTA